MNKLKIIKLSLFTFLFISLNSFAQEVGFDKEYLESLPESIRGDVERELKKQKDEIENKKVFLNPSSKLNKSQTVIEWENFKRQNELKEQSERFGMRLFQSMQSSFMPVNEPNFDANYIVDVGDVLNIIIFDQDTKEFVKEIESDGTVFIPEVGKVYVAGFKLNEAVSDIKKQINKTLFRDSVVSLESVRDIQILMTGEILFPGIYTFNGNTNLLHAISMAGGITETGSFRQIHIKRNGKIISEVDLYSALIFGEVSFRNSLRSGDSIYINTVKNLVRAGSGFNRSGLFEMKSGEKISDLTRFAGGLKSSFLNSDNLLILDRVNSDGSISSIKNTMEEIVDIVLKNYDTLSGKENLVRTVSIDGAVNRPGKYFISDDETLSSLIKRAGGYTKSAYSFGGILLREQAKDLEKYNIEKNYNELIKYLVSRKSSGTAMAGDSVLQLLLSEMKNIEVKGRVVAEFDLLKIRSNPDKDTLLLEGDSIYIPKMSKTVFVHGEVSNPGGLMFSDANKIENYLNMAGGTSKYGAGQFIYVVNPNGVASRIKTSRLSFLNEEISIYPGSAIYVPRLYEFRDNIEASSLYAPIISAFALSLASLSAISND